MSKNNEKSQSNGDFCQRETPPLIEKSQLLNNNRTQPDYLHFSPYGTSKPSSLQNNNNNNNNSNERNTSNHNTTRKQQQQTSILQFMSSTSAKLQSETVAKNIGGDSHTSHDVSNNDIRFTHIAPSNINEFLVGISNDEQQSSILQFMSSTVSKRNIGGDYHTSHNESNNNIRFTHIAPSNINEFVVGISNDECLQIRIQIEKIMSLSIEQWVELHTDPIKFLLTTQVPLFNILKKRHLTQSDQSAESFYLSTAPDGYCSVRALQQLSCRANGSEKSSLANFVDDLICMSHLSNKDIPRLRTIKCHLNEGVMNLNRTHWLGAENFHLFKFNFAFSLWSLNEQDPNYLSLAYTNQIDESQAQLGSHDLTYKQLLCLAVAPNECHHSNDHFYIVPTSCQLGVLQYSSKLKEAMCNMIPHLRTLILPLIPAMTNMTLTQTSGCSDEKQYNLRLLDETICEDRYFSKASSKAVLSECLERGINVEPQLYPSGILRKRLQYTLRRTTIAPSTIVGAGNGLFACCDIGANQLIQTYGGVPADINSYSMGIKTNPCYIIGSAPSDDKWTHGGAINDYIWDESRINCKRDALGNIYSTRLIKCGEELFMSYGMDYNWDCVKLGYHNSLLQDILLMTKMLPSKITTPHCDAISEAYNDALQNNNQSFRDMLCAFFEHDKGPKHINEKKVSNTSDYVSLPLHVMAPAFTESMSTLEWIEMFIMTEWFYRQQCFREHGNPHKVIIAPTLNEPIIGERSSKRLANKPKQMYSLMCDDNKVEYQMTLSDRPIQLHFITTSEIEQVVSDNASINSETHTNDCELKNDAELLKCCVDHQPRADLSFKHNFVRPKNQQQRTKVLTQLADELCPVHQRHKNQLEGLVTLYVNIGSNDEVKRRTIYEIISDSGVDIGFIADCKVTSSNMKSYIFHAKKHLPLGTVVLVFPTQPDMKSNRLIGGLIVTLSKRVKNYKAVSLIPLGALVRIRGFFGEAELSVMSLYHPRHNQEDGSFATRISNEMKISVTRVHQTIHDSIKRSICEEGDDCQVILMGDLNNNIVTQPQSEFVYLTEELNMRHAANELELLQSSYNMFSENGRQVSSRIDFVLYRGAKLKPINSCCLQHDHYFNDHTPVLTTFHIPGHRQEKQFPLFKPGTPRLDWSNLAERNSFIDLAASVNIYEELRGEQRLEAITKDTVKIARTIKPTKSASRDKLVEDLSPVNQALRIARKFLICIFRHITGARKYPQWNESTYVKCLRLTCIRWTKCINKINCSSLEMEEINTVIKHGPSSWNDSTLIQLQTLIPYAISTVQRSSTTKLLQQRRQEFKAYASQREYLHQVQKIGLPIKSILKSSRISYNMSSICLGDSWSSDPGEIAAVLTENFSKWFLADIQKEAPEEDAWLYNENMFRGETARLCIPDCEATLIWNSMSKVKLDQKKILSFQTDVMITPTFTQFIHEVRKCSPNSTGGMSGLTYAMLKGLPETAHKAIYESLVEVWDSKQIPQSWKWRWLLPIPKLEDPSPSQLRPLCLLEILRKLWSTIFVQRIATHIHKHKTFHRGQHSGKGKGTESAVLELAAMLETAKEFRTQIYISSYDLSRAYDSVRWKFLIFAWVRQQVPLSLAEYLVSMDYHSYMSIKTPLAHQVFNELGYNGLLENELAFSPSQGTAQGGVDSSLVFSAFMDILITAIAQLTSQFYIVDIDGNQQMAEPIGYVDDLICPHSSAEGMQNIASLVSAFCLLFHLTLNIGKFRAYAINWGNPNNPIADTMTIFTSGWTPTQVQLQHDGTMTHLGVTWDMSLHNINMFEDIKNKLRESLENIEKSKASLGIKLTAINVTVMAKLIYQAKFSTWQLKQYEELDKMFEGTYRKISKQRTTFPTTMLYAGEDVMGCNFKCFSTEVQKAKLNIWMRSTYGGDSRRAFIMNSMTARVLKQYGCHPPRHGPYHGTIISLPKNVNQNWWFTSLSEHMAKSDLMLLRNSRANEDIPLHFNTERRQQCNHIFEGITTDLEDQTPEDTINETKELDTIIATTISWLRTGQVWMRYNWNNRVNDIVEIVGIDNNNITHYNWTVTNSSSMRPMRVTLENSNSTMLGAGASNVTNINDFFFSPMATYFLLTLNSENYAPQGNTCTINTIRARVVHSQSEKQVSNTHQWFNDIGPSPIEVHTTIETSNLSLIERMHYGGKFRARTVLAKTDDQNVRHALIVSNDTVTHEDAESAHIFGLFVASSGHPSTTQVIISTSKVGINYHRQAFNKPVAHPMVSLMCNKLGHRMFTSQEPDTKEKKATLAGIKNLPNYNLSPIDASIQERAFLLQAMYSSKENFRKLNPLSTITQVSDDWFTTEIKSNVNGTICNGTVGHPLLQDYLTVHQKAEHHKYLCRRDEYRMQTQALRLIDQPIRYWEKVIANVAGDIFKKVPKGAARAFLTRLVWDWHLTGRNKCKHEESLSNAKCLLCGAHYEDQEHIIWHCKHVSMAAVRALHQQQIKIDLKFMNTSTHTGKFTIALNKILSLPKNYALLVGRVHDEHQPQLLELPQPKKSSGYDAQYKSYVSIVSKYANMVMCLYKTRQNILDGKPMISPSRQLILGGETLLGISTDKFITHDGIKINTIIDTSQNAIIQSFQRKRLSSANSPYLRIQQVNRQKREEVQENKNKKKNIVVPITREDEVQWELLYEPTYQAGMNVAINVPKKSPKSYNNNSNSSSSRKNARSKTMKATSNNNVPHALWGSAWANNSCAIDSVTFALSVLFLESTPQQRSDLKDQLRSPNLGMIFDRITLSNLSKKSWQEETAEIREHMFNENINDHIRRGSFVNTYEIIKLLFQTQDITKTTITAWQYTNKYECSNNHTMITNKYMRIISIVAPEINQNLSTIITKAVTQVRHKNTRCSSCKNNTATKVSTTYASPRIMMVYYENQLLHPHIQEYIDNDIIITIQQETIKYKIVSITYYDGSHYIQKVRLHNGDNILYDGMKAEGRAQRQILKIGEEFPSKFISDQRTWNAHSVWFERTQIRPNHSVNYCHSVDINNNSNQPNVHIVDIDNISNKLNVHIVDINSSISNNQLSVSHNCDSRNMSVHSAPHNPNSLVYIIPQPPPALVIHRSDNEEETLKRPREENLIRCTKKNKVCSDMPVLTSDQSNERRPMGCCSPGTGEGRSGQG